MEMTGRFLPNGEVKGYQPIWESHEEVSQVFCRLDKTNFQKEDIRSEDELQFSVAYFTHRSMEKTSRKAHNRYCGCCLRQACASIYS